MSAEVGLGAAMAEQRFIEAIADKKRVCCCICPVGHGRVSEVCQRFIPAGEPLVMERVGEQYSTRCMPCARALGYVRPKPSRQ